MSDKITLLGVGAYNAGDHAEHAEELLDFPASMTLGELRAWFDEPRNRRTWIEQLRLINKTDAVKP